VRVDELWGVLDELLEPGVIVAVLREGDGGDEAGLVCDGQNCAERAEKVGNVGKEGETCEVF